MKTWWGDLFSGIKTHFNSWIILMAILYIAIALVSLYVAAVGEGITVGIAIIVGWIAFGAFQVQIRRYYTNLKSDASPGDADDEDDQIRLPPA